MSVPTQASQSSQTCQLPKPTYLFTKGYLVARPPSKKKAALMCSFTCLEGRKMTETSPVQASVFPEPDGQNIPRVSERHFLSDSMIRFVLLHLVGLNAAALRGYTCERRKSDFPHAKADLDIYDGAGKLVFQGRDFPSGIAGYWKPSRASLPQSAPSGHEWGLSVHAQILNSIS